MTATRRAVAMNLDPLTPLQRATLRALSPEARARVEAAHHAECAAIIDESWPRITAVCPDEVRPDDQPITDWQAVYLAGLAVNIRPPRAGPRCRDDSAGDDAEARIVAVVVAAIEAERPILTAEEMPRDLDRLLLYATDAPAWVARMADHVAYWGAGATAQAVCHRWPDISAAEWKRISTALRLEALDLALARVPVDDVWGIRQAAIQARDIVARGRHGHFRARPELELPWAVEALMYTASYAVGVLDVDHVCGSYVDVDDDAERRASWWRIGAAFGRLATKGAP